MAAKRFINQPDANVELKRSELRLQKAQTIAHVGNWEIDLSRRIIWGSEEALRIYGFDQKNSELPLDLIQKISLPEYRRMLDEALRRLIQNNEPYEVEFKIRRAGDGEIRDLYSKGELAEAGGGTEKKIIGVVQDITDRKKVEEALRESEERFSKAYKTSPISFMIANFEDGRIIEVNDAFSNISGFTREEALTSSTLILNMWVHEEDRQHMITTLHDGRAVVRQETLLRAKNGNILTVLLSAQVIQLSHRNCIISSIEDITARKHAEEDLRESEDKYRSIFENVQDVYYETTIDGVIIDVSPSISILSKGLYKREELIGQPMDSFYVDPKERVQMIDELKKNTSVGDFEIKLRNKDGSIIYCSISSKLQFDSGGSPEKLIGSLRDITERKHFEKELVKAKEKAEESDRLKTAFLHNISHEIRTPMNAIMGFATLLNETDADAATRKSYIEVISQSSDHLLSIISDIVDISNIEADLVKINREEFNLNTAFKAIYNQHIQKAKEKKIDLAFENEFGDSEASIITDKTKLIQILSNLIGNAIKFTHDGKVNYSYKLKLGVLEFTVSDTGIGIIPEQQSRVFDRFYQVHNQASRHYEGTGLGLAISKAYVELLGGTIMVISDYGSGSSFVFTIPYEKREVQKKNESHKADKKSFFFSVKKKILVAEDVESNFQLIKYFLTDVNAEIIHAVNGQEAVDYCMSDKSIDLVLMDIKMPVMDGYTATKILRENKISIPVIAQTAYADDKENAMKSGCTAFISKPFDKFGLLRVINELI
jgi:PAS domain S-box-containing protein